MICHPEKHDVEQIKTIWMLCFGDDRETIDIYFDRCFSPDGCYISKTGDTVQAVLQMINCTLVIDGEQLDARYMYAVCTHTDYQGRGIMTSLIKESLKSEKQSGTKAVLCVPANERLFEFYKRLGFVNAIYCTEKEYDRDYVISHSLKCDYELNGDFPSFNEKRNEVLNRFSKDSFVSYSDKYISLAKGFSYSTVATENAYAIFIEKNGAVEIADSCFNETGFNELCYALKNETNADKYIIKFNGNDNDVLKGVIKVFDCNTELSKKIYFGIEME